VRAKTALGLESKSRLSAIIARRGQSALHRLRIERKLRNLSIAAGAALTAVALVVVLLVAGVLGGGGRPSLSAVVSALGPATVFVKANSGETGSGWALSAADGLIVTNGHVVNGGQTFQVGIGGALRQATVVADAPCEDLAVLRVSPATGLKTMPLGSQAQVKAGDEVVALGYPRSASGTPKLTATAGVVSVAKTQYQEVTPDIPLYPNVIQTDTPLNPGNSGGPLVSVDEKLIGVNSAVRSQDAQGRAIQNQNYAIGVDRVKEVVGRLRTGRSLGWFGFNLTYPSTAELGTLPPGVETAAAVAGTPAAKAVQGKRLLMIGIDGKRIANTLASYCGAAAGLRSGQVVTLTVMDVTNPARPGKPTALRLRVP
jgi:putative serine protease PepD